MKHKKTDDLAAAITDVTRAFRKLGHVYNFPDMVTLQLGQLGELVQHHARGEHVKELNEWADMVSIAWQAIRVLGGVHDVEEFIIRRIREKVIPSAAKSMEKYRLSEDT